MVFQIKICGVTNVDDARAAIGAGADAVGLNFFSKSRRFVDSQAARRIAEQIPNGVTKVGVFVNHGADQIAEIMEGIGLDAVQLHGDEKPALIAQLPAHLQVIRAYRCGSEGLVPLARYIDECRTLGRLPDAILIDANAGSDFGGSGGLADWALIAQHRQTLAGLPLILAGGLTPHNVATAIAAVAPHGVDVATGVEREPGRKDPELVAQFIAAARHALSRI